MLRRIARTCALGVSAFAVSASDTLAQAAGATDFGSRLWQSLESPQILMLAVFGGAMSFALLSASWMIRERNKLVAQNRGLRQGLADLRARNDRNEALVNIPDQRLVIWNGGDETPEVLGDMPPTSGAPSDPSEFLAFGSWVSAESLTDLEAGLRELRTAATAFDLVIATRSAGVVEIQGRTSGSHAFLRFTDLGTERAEHARINTAHEELLSTFETVQSLFETTETPVWLRRHDGSLFWANKAYANAVEVEHAAEAVRRNLELFDHELREEIRKAEDADGRFSGIRPAIVAGNRRSMDIISVRCEHGSAGMAIDRSDVESVQETLRETNESHSRVLDQMATAVAMFDKSQRLTFHNSGFRQLWNLDPGLLESNPTNSELLDAMRDEKLLPEHPDWRKWRESQLTVYTALEPREEWWHLLNGQTIRVVASPLNQGGATWIFENVTERLALESNYKSLMHVQGETLDHLNDAVAVFGSDGKLKLFNPTLETLWAAPDLVVNEGLHIAKVVENWTDTVSNGADLEAILGAITGFDDHRENLEGRLRLADDRTIEYRLVPLPEGQNMLTFADITANVNFEKALRERAELLEESDLLKSKFIEHVSYELRAPLTTISGFGEMLEAPGIGELNEKQAEYLSHINESAEVLKAMVDDILDLASIDAGTMMLDVQPVKLKKLAEAVCANLKASADVRNVTLSIDIASGSTTCHADEERMAQILHNLLANAIEHSPDGGKVTIAAERNDGFNIIRVTDEGDGVPADKRDQIFGRFESTPSEGRRKGTGLGLSIVQGFVTLHGGSVHVEDGPERGASFVCSLPVKPKPADGDGEAAAVA